MNHLWLRAVSMLLEEPLAIEFYGERETPGQRRRRRHGAANTRATVPQGSLLKLEIFVQKKVFL